MQLNNSHISTSTRSPVVSRRLTVADHPQLRDRFAARWRSGALDRALAAGVSPESTPALALRARRLSELSQRRRVADGLRELIAEGLGPQSPTDPRILPNRTALRAARAELEQLADALAKPGPVSPHGVAQARILLTDGTGPLYDRNSKASLRASAVSAAESLADPIA